MNTKDRIEEEVSKYSRKYGHFPRSIMVSKSTYEKLLKEWAQYRVDQRVPILDVHIEANSKQKIDVVLTRPEGDYSTPDIKIDLS